MVHRNVVLSQLDEMATRDALMSIVLNTFFSGDRGDRGDRGVR